MAIYMRIQNPGARIQNETKPLSDILKRFSCFVVTAPVMAVSRTIQHFILLPQLIFLMPEFSNSTGCPATQADVIRHSESRRGVTKPNTQHLFCRVSYLNSSLLHACTFCF